MTYGQQKIGGVERAESTAEKEAKKTQKESRNKPIDKANSLKNKLNNTTTRTNIDINIKQGEGVMSSLIINTVDDNTDEIINSLDLKDKALDGFLIYDYPRNRNVLIFKPKVSIFEDEDIHIRRIDVFKLQQENNTSFIGELEETNSAKLFTITKKEARKNVEDSGGNLSHFGIMINNVKDLPDKPTDISLSYGTKIYKYDDYKTKYEPMYSEYQKIIDVYKKDQLTFDNFPVSDSYRLDREQKIIFKTITSVIGYDSITALANGAKNPKGENGQGLNGAAYPNEGEPDGLVNNFLNNFKLKYGFDLKAVYMSACGSPPDNPILFYLSLKDFMLRTDFNVYKDSFLLLPKAITTRYYIGLDDLLVNYLGSTQYNFKDMDSVQSKYKSLLAHASKITTTLNKILSKINQLEKMQDLNEQEWASYLADEIKKDKAEISIIDSLIGINTRDDFEKVIYYLKRMYVLNFTQRILFKLNARSVNEISSMSEQEKNGTLNFLDTLFKNNDTNKSGGEYAIINTFKHTQDKIRTFIDSYDYVCFLGFISEEVESKEKMGLFIDNNIERNKIYLYQIFQMRGDVLMGAIV